MNQTWENSERPNSVLDFGTNLGPKIFIYGFYHY